MKRLLNYILIVTLSVGIVGPGAVSVSAKSIAELEKELADLESERSGIDSDASDAKAKIAENEKRQAKVKEKIAEIDRDLEVTEANLEDKQTEINATNAEISTLEASISETEGQITKTEEELDVLADEIDELIKRIEERDILIKNRLRSIQYNGGNINYFQVLFGAQDFGDLINRATAVTKIFESDQSIMDAQQQDKANLEDKRQSVKEKKEQLVADKTKLDDQKAELEDQRATLLAQQDELSSLQDQLNQQRDTQVAVVDELEDEHADLEEHTMSIEEERQVLADQERILKKMKEDKLAQLAKDKEKETKTNTIKNVSNGSGTLIWPSNGSTSSEYGWRFHPIYKENRFHGGLDITSDSGLSIVAAADGVVTGTYYSGENVGYGNYIVIHHEDINMTTLYAHLASVQVSAGQIVKQGEQIGIMGTTGGSTGVHLHFEVYEGGYGVNKVNPRKHLP
ncbi:peptidoglycan DD-metalloendopeptidase family protein [Amphibacillus sp. MSJ-3]|uniref:murein hydrolase activator EnvC family protein n=1 Tax=Amphibacillus sp. MSJ-3 TaxID=2841505 RepID=UPI001C0EC783|nr:peptidoglycan DD-metalloendopeptidase family protein [Amphibacillus sp. MSJ-3]MBU5593966.1 peptidoglycan DD-metalloendopeptidase family protein [Amphibacillus sp. MSJ-3]